MSKMRVYELAKELGMDNKELIARLEKFGIAVKAHSSSLEESDVERIRKEFSLGERNKVIEKRVKSTVIRRRAIRQPKPAEAEEELRGAEIEEVLAEAPGEKDQGEKPEEEKKGKEAPEVKEKEEKRPKVRVKVLKKAVPKKEEERLQEEKAKAKEPPPEKVEPEVRAPEKKGPIEEVADSKKKRKRPVEVVVEEAPVKKKAFVRHLVEKKERRSRKGKERQARKSWKEEKKKTILEMKETEITTPKAIKRRVKVEEVIRVGDLAKKMGVKANELIAKLIALGVMVTINQSIDIDTATLIAGEFGYSVETVGVDYQEIVEKSQVSLGKLKPRAPVITIMGHVDHGKTSLLDVIRKTNVIEGESGGITQAIGAYHVHIDGKDIVFLDTPGHEAFTAMRARGAQVTDIVVLVVAAEDGVMDQTVEAINHAKAAGVPIIVAVNKIDKANADPERIKQQLAELELVPEEWGGDTIYAEVSAKKNVGIEELMELILIQADIMELKADPDMPAQGVIIESKLDRGRGPVATVIVQRGTLREGDALVSRKEYARVRAMANDKGQRVEEAGPSMPVEVIGFSDVPQAGMDFMCVEDEKKARSISEYWVRKERERELSKTSKITLEQLYERIKEGGKEFNAIIKGDVHGSVEALSDALLKLSTDDVKLEIIHGSAGTITETDVMLASASDAIILGFKVRPDLRVSELADNEGVDIKLYDVIYDTIADVRAAMEGLLEPIYEEVVQGRAEVRQIFKVPRVGAVAGSYVTDGKVTRNSSLRLLRDGVVVFEGPLLSLRRFKDDAKEVASGFECGIGIKGFNDIKEGDIIESYIKEEVERKL
ncbi:MAG: translation initiation factor IF-2 [Thermodesulfobacteriota bacterium]|nr:translation initiation factor IF-2 [Thermodesulfobacteriota bacterium]